MIIRASQLVTCEGTQGKWGEEMNHLSTLPHGAVLIQDDTILAVDTQEELTRQLAGEAVEILDASGMTVLPGFVDSGTALVFAQGAGQIAPHRQGEHYFSPNYPSDGYYETLAATKEATQETLVQQATPRLDALLAQGVTTAECKSFFGGDRNGQLTQLGAMAQLNANHPMDLVPTFFGGSFVPDGWRGREGDYLDELVAMLPQIRKEGLADFVDVRCHPEGFSQEQSLRYLERAKAFQFPVKLQGQYCPSSVAVGVETQVTSFQLVGEYTQEEMAPLVEHEIMATFSPLSAFIGKQPTPSVGNYIQQGGGVALATDTYWGNHTSATVPLTIALACFQHGMTVEAVITAMTLNSAAALGLAHKIGSIQPGKQADILFLNQPSIHCLPYATGANLVGKVMKKGKLLVGA